MITRPSISKTVAASLLGMLALAPLVQAEVDASVIKFAERKTKIDEIELKGKPVSKEDRMKNAQRRGMWVSGYAEVREFASIKRGDTINRIYCPQELLYNKHVIFEGDSVSEPQLVHIVADTENYTVEVEVVSNVKEKTGFYVLFTPETIYLFDYEAVNRSTGKKEPLFRKYENRNKTEEE